MVNFELHFDALRSALTGSENVEFLALEAKGHNPNYTKDAVKLLQSFNADLRAKNKKKKQILMNCKKNMISKKIYLQKD